MGKFTGGPAFPCEDIVRRDANGGLHGPSISSDGMTIADYFAAKAIAGLIGVIYVKGATAKDDGPITEATIAEQAYHFADAMLAERVRRAGTASPESAALLAILAEVTPGHTPHSTDSYLPAHLIEQARAALIKAGIV